MCGGSPQPSTDDTPLVLENSRDQRGTDLKSPYKFKGSEGNQIFHYFRSVRSQILSIHKIFNYFMHMRAKNNMGISDLFPSDPLNFLGRGEYGILSMLLHGRRRPYQNTVFMHILVLYAFSVSEVFD